MPERDETAGELQTLLLSCLLDDDPLPGTDRSIVFPDFQYIRDADRLLIARDNLGPDFSLPEPVKPVEQDSAEAQIKGQAQAQGDRFYVYFQPVRWAGDRAQVALEVRLAPSQEDVLPLGLGGVSAVFEEQDGEWRVVEGPVSMAS